MKKSTVFSAIALLVIGAIIAYVFYSVNYVNQMTKNGPCNKPAVDNTVKVYGQISEQVTNLVKKNTENMKNGVSVDYSALVAQFDLEEKYFAALPAPVCMNDWKEIQAKSFHETTLAYDAYNHGSVTGFSEHLDKSSAYREQASDELDRILKCYPFCK